MELILGSFPCSLCGGTSHRERYPASRVRDVPSLPDYRCTSAGYGVHFRVVQCSICSFVYCTPRPVESQIAALYTEAEDDVYVRETAGRDATFRRRLRALLTHHPPPARLLDVGAHVGAFVTAARAAGYDAEGLEPSDWAVRVAAASGVPVTKGSLATGLFPGDSFDIVTMWDVIEHLHDPRQGLSLVHEMTRPGGMLVVHTMDIGSVAARCLGRRWPWLMEMHLHYFSRKTLVAMLEASGFDVLSVRSEARFISIEYFASRIVALGARGLGSALLRIARRTGIDRTLIPISLGDLVTAHAVKRRTP